MAPLRPPTPRPRGRGRGWALGVLTLLSLALARPAAGLIEVDGAPRPLLEPGPRQVALTFDDGPSAAHTGKILDVLARYGIRATFFVTGQQAAAHPELLRRMTDEGHSVQNHTWGHAWLPRYSDGVVAGQLARAQEAILAETGRAPRCLRPPFGALSPRVARAAAGLGLEIVTWDVDPWDWKRPGADAVATHVLRHTGGGDIVLFHDTAGRSTLDALPRIIEGLRARGLQFVSLCSVPGPARLQAGEDGLL